MTPFNGTSAVAVVPCRGAGTVLTRESMQSIELSAGRTLTSSITITVSVTISINISTTIAVLTNSRR